MTRIPPLTSEGDSRSVLKISRVIKGVSLLPVITVSHFLCDVEGESALSSGKPVIAFINGSRLVNDTAVLPASKNESNSKLGAREALHEELMLALDDSDPDVSRAAVRALAELDGPAVVNILRARKQTADFGTRFRILATLTRFGDSDAFEQMVIEASSVNFSSQSSAYRDYIGAIMSFSSRGFRTSSAPAESPKRFAKIMGRVARSKDIQIRRAAIMALRGLNDPDTFSILSTSLDDPDFHIRYDSMFTLCLAMNSPDLRCPATSLFKNNEKKYIDGVRTWSKESKR